MSRSQQAVQERYRRALDALTQKLQQDRTVLAAIVYGSYCVRSGLGEVGHRLVDRHGRRPQSAALRGPLPHRRRRHHPRQSHPAQALPVEHRRLAPGRFGLDFTFAHSTLLFSKDESIAAWYKDAERIGARDRDYQLLRRALPLLATLTKAQKWYQVKQDYNYSFLWLLNVADQLASVECILNGQAPGREVIHQALAFNPEFFNAIYTDLIAAPKNARTLEAALQRVETYLDDHLWDLFRPLLEYLEEAESMRTVSEIEEHFKMEGADFACEWLVEKGSAAKDVDTAAPHRKKPRRDAGSGLLLRRRRVRLGPALT